MRRVLVVDDEEVIAEVLRDVLIDEGYDVEVAHDGQEAVANFRQHPADLVVTDLMMPVMDGRALIATLQNGAFEHRPRIIAMSAGRIPPDVRATVQAALEKPFTVDEMLAVVAEVIPIH